MSIKMQFAHAGARLILVAFVLSLMQSTEAKVVGHWRFSGTPGQTATVGTEFPNLVSGTGVGSAVVFDFDPTKDTTNYKPYYTNAFDAPFTAVRTSLTNATLLATDITSAYTIQSPAKKNSGKSYYDTAVGDCGLPIKIEDPNDKLKNPSFTIEMIVRDGAYNSGRVLCSMPGQGMDAFRMMGLAGNSCNAYIGVSNTVSNASRFDNTVGNGNQASFDTIRYHHVALVVNGTDHKVRLYRDGQLYRGAFVYGITTKTYSATDCINYMAGAPLVVGATMNDTRCCHNVQFEELRYSDEALSPKDFMRKAAPQIPDKSPLVYLPLDTDYTSLAYGDVLPEAVVAANVDAETGTTPETWTGNVPELVPDVWKPAVRDGHKEVIRKANLGSASFSTGSVYYADCPLLPNEPKITIEFFFKMDTLNLANKTSVELLGTRNTSNTTMNDGNGGGKPWYIYVDSTA